MKHSPALALAVAVVAFLYSAVVSAADGNPAGRWLLDIRTADIGRVETVVTISREGSAFEGRSREGAAGDYMSFFPLLLAKLFTDYFENGALLHIRDGVISGDSVSARIISAVSSMRFRGVVRGDSIAGTLTRGGRLCGELRGRRYSSNGPLRDYPALVQSALNTTEQRIYNPAVMRGGEWRDFRETMHEAAAIAQDDLDLLFAFFLNRDDVPFSHFFLLRDKKGMERFAAADPVAVSLSLSELQDTIAYLRIPSFANTGENIDSVFAVITDKAYPALIIDLRGNPGGNVSAMRVASHLVDSARYGGIFLTGAWFGRNSEPPAPDYYDRLPLLTEANMKLLWEGIHQQEGICLRLVPSPPHYKGRVVVLVDGATASACEPLVYGLKQYNLATIIGERTAGAMLSSEVFALEGDWSIVVPTADYYTSDGFRIDRRGVEPHIEVESEEALSHALEMLGRQYTR